MTSICCCKTQGISSTPKKKGFINIGVDM